MSTKSERKQRARIKHLRAIPLQAFHNKGLTKPRSLRGFVGYVTPGYQGKSVRRKNKPGNIC